VLHGTSHLAPLRHQQSQSAAGQPYSHDFCGLHRAYRAVQAVDIRPRDWLPCGNAFQGRSGFNKIPLL